ncbi:MAG: PIG-L deacetylase family protein [Acidimicrobiia bacterium]
MWGFEEPGELDQLLVISPHLDDAVVSCGALLLAHRGASVATLFAASPATYSDPLNEHDTDCGFTPGDDTMALRRDEDVRALAAVGATPRWLHLHQHSHVERADPIVEPPGAVDALVETIADLQPTCVVAPLGLSHPDHQACHASALAARERADPVPWLWYSDLPYVFIPRVLAARFRALHKVGITATPACPSVSNDFPAKWRAFGEYVTQVPVLDRLWRLRERLERAGEQYWTLDR